MPTPRIVSAAGFFQAPGLTDTELPVTILNALPNDIVIVVQWGLSLASNNDGGVEVPAGWVSLFDDWDASGLDNTMMGRISSPDEASFTLRRTGTTELAWFAATFIIRGVSTGTTFLDDQDATTFSATNPWTLPAMTVTGDDRLVVHLAVALSSNSSGLFTVSVDGWGVADSASTAIGAGELAAIPIWAAFDANSPSAVAQFPAGATDVSGYAVSLAFIPAPVVAIPAAIVAPENLRLDCADTYELWITEADYMTRIDQVGWSRIAYEYVLDEISTATVTLPDNLGGLYCCADRGGVKDWEYGLLIERNGREVWSGPVRTIAREPDALRVTAADNLSRMTKLPSTWRTKNYPSVDSGVLFRNIVNIHTVDLGRAYSLQAPEVFTGVFLARKLSPADGEYAWTVLKELLDGSVDAWMRLNTLYVWRKDQGWVYADFLNPDMTDTLDGPYNSVFDFEYGTFTNESFVEKPLWSISGEADTNYVAVAAADNGEEGFRELFVAINEANIGVVGPLYHFDSEPLARPGSDDVLADSVYQRRADTVLAQRTNSPAVTTPGVLAPNAPVDVENLRPGSIWRLDIHDACYGQLLQAGRLKRVNVEVNATAKGIVEEIKPTLYPIGWSGANDVGP